MYKGASRNSRYSGTRRGIGDIRRLLRGVGGVGTLFGGVRKYQGVSGVSRGC